MKAKKIGPNDTHTFDDIIKKHNTFVKFYMEGCGHCISMKDSWDNMVKILENNYDYNYIILDVHSDALQNSTYNIAKTITGFPTILEIKQGGIKGKEYQGDRSQESLIQFCEKELGFKKKQMGGGGDIKKKMKKHKSKKKRSNKLHKTRKYKRKCKRRSVMRRRSTCRY